MAIGILFWVLMLLWALFGVVPWPLAGANPRVVGGNLLLFILVALLGWQVFGPALHK